MKQSPGILTDVFERITDAFVALDTNWCYTYMNKKAGEIFQRNPAQMIGKHIWTEFPEGIDQTFYKAYYRAMAEQQYIHVEEYYPPYDKWFENHIYPSPDGLSVFFRDVTEKKKGEEALKEKNNFIESIINASPDIIYIYDIEERKNIYVNEGIQINLGYNDDEIKEMGDQLISILMHPEDFDYYLQNTYPKYETLKDKEIITHEYRMKSKEGNWHWLCSKESIFLRKPDGSPKQIFGITTNITAQKRAIEIIKKNQQQLQLIYDSTTDVLFLIDVQDEKEFSFISMNETGLQAIGVTLEQIMNKNIKDIIPLPSLDLVLGKYKEAIETKKNIQWEEITEYPTGIRTGIVTVSPIYNDVGKCIQLVASVHDITERKKTEQAIINSEEKYRTLVEQASDAIFIADTTGRFITVNTSACKLAQYSEKELLQMSIHDFAVVEDIQREPFHFDELKQGKAVITERVMKRKDGSVLNVEITAKLLSDGRLLTFIRNITERKKAEQVLKESEERFSTIFKAAPGSMMLFSLPDGNTVEVNDNFSQITGYTRQEAIGKNTGELGMWANLADRDKFLSLIKEHGVVTDFEADLKHKSGIRLNGMVSGHLITMQENKFLLGTFYDITDRKEAEENLRNSNETINNIIENSPSLIYLFDAEGKFILGNKNFEKLLKFPLSEFVGKTRESFFSKEICDLHRNNDLSVIKTQMPISLEEANMENGVMHYYITEKFPLFDSKANVYAVGGISTDITERKKAETKLVENENYLRTILHTEPECVKVLNRKGELLSMNPAGLAMIEADNEQQVLGHRMTELVDEKYRIGFNRLSKNVFNGTPGTFEFEVTGLKGGRRWLKTHAVPLKDAAGKIINLLGVTRDITQRKKAEEEITNTTEQLRQLTTHLQNIREEERKRIGREIHDELGQQLTAIKMDAVWIDKKTIDEASPIKSKLKNIITLLDGSNESVRKILSELRPGVLDDYGLVDALEWQGMRFTESTGIPVIFTNSEAAIKLPEQISTCIFRLYQESLTNITRYAQATKVLTLLSIKDECIILTVKDDGNGFDMAAVQSKKTFGILGMKERVLSLNGRFELVSAKGKGTKIVISIPYKG